MQAAELEADFDVGLPRPHRRAAAIIVASVTVTAIAAAAWVHPDISLFPGKSAAPASASVLRGDYRVATIDFISATTGWLVAVMPTGEYVLIHTTDGGDSWTRQLSGTTEGHSTYLKFFDAGVGVFALTGTRPVVRRTADGGATWTSRPAASGDASALAWSFVDSDHGWLLAAPASGVAQSTAGLYRTEDGGLSWIDLGVPVRAPDVAFDVQFSYLTTGWLTTVSGGPYAYRSQDFGSTWTRVALPAPATGWPSGGQFFVAARPTAGQGVVASVIHFAAFQGRSGAGGEVRGYPPLTVRSFDGGRLHTYLYTTLLDQVATRPFAQDTPPNESELATTDGGRTWGAISPPPAGGALGFADAAHWWWIGQGATARTSDAGATWTDPRDIGVVDALPGSLQMLDANHAWFAGVPGSRTMLESTDDAGEHWTTTPLPLL